MLRTARSLKRALSAVLLMTLPPMAWSAGLPGGGVAPAGIADIEKELPGTSAPAQRPEDAQADSIIEKLQVESAAKPVGESQVPEGSSFVLASIKVVGNQSLPEGDIIAVVKPYIGKTVTAATLQEVAQAITALLTGKGYVTSRCLIPAQEVKDGLVVLQVEEDKLGEVLLTGPSSYRYDPRLFKRHFHDLTGQTISTDMLTSRLQLLARLPATRIQPILRKAGFGRTDLLLHLSDLKDFNALYADNRGSRFTGQHRMNYKGVLYNISGAGDQLATGITVNPLMPKFLNHLALDYTRPVGDRGGRMQAGVSTLTYRLDPDEVGYSDIRYEGSSDGVYLRYEEPFLVGREGDYWWGVGVERKWVSADTIYNISYPGAPAGTKFVDSEDNLLVLDVGVRLGHLDTLLAGLTANNEFSANLKHPLEGVLGSMTQEEVDRKLDYLANVANPTTVSGPIGNVEGLDVSFWKLYLNYQRTQTLPRGVMGVLKLGGEYTPSRKIPGAYEFSGADTGPTGWKADMGFSRAFFDNALTATLGYQHEAAYSFFRDTEPGCNGTNTARGANSCSNGSAYLGVNWRYRRFFAEMMLYENLPDYDSNRDQVRVNLGARW
ncbi:MAG: hypothetical protein H7831_05055 [Magnetococcus sp. WYHC-3]